MEGVPGGDALLRGEQLPPVRQAHRHHRERPVLQRPGLPGRQGPRSGAHRLPPPLPAGAEKGHRRGRAGAGVSPVELPGQLRVGPGL